MTTVDDCRLVELPKVFQPEGSITVARLKLPAPDVVDASTRPSAPSSVTATPCVVFPIA